MSWPSTDARYVYTAGNAGPDGVNLVAQTFGATRSDSAQNFGLAAFSSVSGNGSVVDTVFSLRNGVLNQYTVLQPSMEYAVVNAGSYVGGPVSPAEIAALFGANMSTPGKPARRLANLCPLLYVKPRFWLGGSPAPLYYVSPGQINFQVPTQIAGGTKVGFQLSYGGTTTLSLINLPISNATPALFTGNGLVAVNGASWTTLQAMANQIAVFLR